MTATALNYPTYCDNKEPHLPHFCAPCQYVVYAQETPWAVPVAERPAPPVRKEKLATEFEFNPRVCGRCNGPKKYLKACPVCPKISPAEWDIVKAKIEAELRAAVDEDMEVKASPKREKRIRKEARETVRATRDRGGRPRECSRCASPFKAKTSRAAFCSDTCRAKDRTAKSRDRMSKARAKA